MGKRFLELKNSNLGFHRREGQKPGAGSQSASPEQRVTASVRLVKYPVEYEAHEAVLRVFHSFPFLSISSAFQLPPTPHSFILQATLPGLAVLKVCIPWGLLRNESSRALVQST